MSATTTSNPITRSVLEALTDYDLHHSGDPENPASAPAPNEREDVQHIQNPEDWPIDHRDVPPFRPINRELDMNERPFGANPVENVIINIMFTGVFLSSVSDTVEEVTVIRIVADHSNH
jgi:hypothetical protein